MRNPAALSMAMVAVVVMLSSGCSTPDPTPVTTSKPAATPIFASDAEALAAAEAAYEAYQTMEDQIFADGGKDPDRIRPYAVRDALEDALSGYASFETNGFHESGNAVVDTSTLKERSDAKSINAIATLICLDVGDTEIFDATGESIVPADREPRRTYITRFDWSEGSNSLVLSSREAWGGASVCA